MFPFKTTAFESRMKFSSGSLAVSSDVIFQVWVMWTTLPFTFPFMEEQSTFETQARFIHEAIRQCFIASLSVTKRDNK